MTHRVAAQYNNLMYHFARALNALANAWYENWVAVERAAQPYVDSLVQAFTRYCELTCYEFLEKGNV